MGEQPEQDTIQSVGYFTSLFETLDLVFFCTERWSCHELSHCKKKDSENSDPEETSLLLVRTGTADGGAQSICFMCMLDR